MRKWGRERGRWAASACVEGLFSKSISLFSSYSRWSLSCTLKMTKSPPHSKKAVKRKQSWGYSQFLEFRSQNHTFCLFLFAWPHQVSVAVCRVFQCAAWASLVVAHRLGSMWAQLPQGMWDLSFPARDQTHIPWTGRGILNHWTTREVPKPYIFYDSPAEYG